jgi:hypothetical protein
MIGSVVGMVVLKILLIINFAVSLPTLLAVTGQQQQVATDDVTMVPAGVDTTRKLQRQRYFPPLWWAMTRSGNLHGLDCTGLATQIHAQIGSV